MQILPLLVIGHIFSIFFCYLILSSFLRSYICLSLFSFLLLPFTFSPSLGLLFSLISSSLFSLSSQISSHFYIFIPWYLTSFFHFNSTFSHTILLPPLSSSSLSTSLLSSALSSYSNSTGIPILSFFLNPHNHHLALNNYFLILESGKPSF